MKTYLATGVLGLVAISGYFIFTANDKSSPDPNSLATPVVSQGDVRAQVFDDTPLRKVEATEAETALAHLGLWEPSEAITWDSRVGDNGNYVFTNLIYADEDVTLSAAHFELSGVRMLEEEQVYFDRLNAEQISSAKNGDVATIGAFGIKLPETTTLVEGLSLSIDEEEVSIIDFVTSAIKPGILPEYPEVFVENLKMTEIDEVWDVKKSKSFYERTGDNTEQKKEIINTTRLDFASITKEEFEDGYQLQLSNFVRDDYTYYGDKKKSELRTLNVSGLDSEIMDKIETRLDFGVHSNPGTMFEPLFLSLDLQGLKIESEAEIFRVDQVTVRHSDTRGNQFTRRIDVPQIYVAKKTQPASNEENERATYSPVHMMLDSWGYDDLTASVSSQTSYDKVNKSVAEDGARITLIDAAEFDLAYKVNNISNFSDIFRNRAEDDGEQNTNIPSIDFGQFSMTDRGLNERMFAQMADDQGLTVEEIKQAMKGSAIFAKTLAKTDYQKELAQKMIDAYSAFTNDGGKFQVNLNPQRPIYFNEFFGLGQSIEDASLEKYEAENSESGEISSEGFTASDDFTDDVSKALQNEAMDNLLRDMNISFEHFIAD